ncbi:hypothetical protein NLM27_26960 [Bradyrhizobium sp. CCGB12]|uniref:hypothetical protein n=1 Tax=Bradyrhizobium sp. CCGB12 TaxID=2949632 RepID=UPI0020B24C81|nr:hypothetical protein [Bradyrhizobium sp. CCGB12]MCP3392390.1 hypothetical protein [Bradyrhizobium sp. CCGB12]
MPKIPIDLQATHRVERDGTHTVTVTVSGLSSPGSVKAGAKFPAAKQQLKR